MITAQQSISSVVETSLGNPRFGKIGQTREVRKWSTDRHIALELLNELVLSTAEIEAVRSSERKQQIDEDVPPAASN